jgi:hypothetical protein
MAGAIPIIAGLFRRLEPGLGFGVETLFFAAAFLAAFFLGTIRVFSYFPGPKWSRSVPHQCISNLSKNQSSPLTF